MATATTPADRKKAPAKPPAGDYSKLDAAAILGVSARWVNRRLALKKIPGAYKLGELVRFRRAEFDAWREAGCPGA